MEKMDKQFVIDEFKRLKDEILNKGSFAFYKSGEWFAHLVMQTLENYFEKNTKDFFYAKYPGKSNEFIEKKLVNVAVGNAMIVGGVAGAIISAGEVSSAFGVSIPVSIPAILVTIICELFLITMIQLKLIIEIARLNDVELDQKDPEDILIIFAYASGAITSEEFGNLAMQVGAKWGSKLINDYITKKTTEELKKRFGKKIGVKLLQQTVAKYLVPGISIAIGAVWNGISTKVIAKIASKHFKKIKKERSMTSNGL